ncbi:MAG: phage holin family protein [Candidatus Rokuibacteriota bacterium]
MQKYEKRAAAETDSAPSTRALLSALARKAGLLVQKEIELARAEMASDLRSWRILAVGLGIALLAALIGVNLLLVAVVLALAAYMPGWLAALIVASVVFAIGAIAGRVGWQRRVRTPMVLTRKTLKEDWQWMKEQVT